MRGFAQETNDSSDEKAFLSDELTFDSPSKLNLFFRVLGKREDGFHEIASLFQAIDLCDTLSIKHSSNTQLTCTDPALACDGSNLVLKALYLFRKKTGILDPVHFHLLKRVPVQAGLGGGSGNAATALWALNELFGRPAAENDLCLWSQELGSDVPFFFSKGTSYCTGRGEILQDFSVHNTRQSLWVAKPSYGLSTPEVFKTCRAADLPAQDPLQSLQRFSQGEGHYYNDLEVAAFQLRPSLEVLKKNLLASGFSRVVMTGSGTAFFCLGDASLPSLESVQFFRAQFLFRDEGSWYKLP